MDFLLIDCYSIAYASHFSAPMRGQDGNEVQAIYVTLRTIAKRARENPTFAPVLLWDGHAKWRYDLYPEYKSGRKKGEAALAARESVSRQMPHLRIMLSKLGLMQLHDPNAEADDIGHQLGNALVAKGHTVKFLTGDHDWLQNLQPGASWLDHRTDTHIATPDEMEAAVGARTARDFVQIKAMVGDTSDSIEGVAKIGEKTAPKILAEFGSVEGFFAKVDVGEFVPKLVAHKNLASEEGRAIYRRNLQLMDLSLAPRLSSESIVTTRENVDHATFLDWCEHFQFRYFLQNPAKLTGPFDDLVRRADYSGLFQALHQLGDIEEEE
ncbi:5'-3' exonuclease H3TH domain-containing protein [Noviherbaspirillum pedocola]|uniref:5'-3' exonuclease n=1 Tax=Noviherbaspirillum pedocola TaxID=2801341 RepID=A0A934T0D4_9BURK|nr:5'-3' exonuclease H3TH domain-containing protein [Noviherbaspirillum pedocola]MBK4738665.1 5'-3' exonuclease [Noviherbaspirillum pedocola]